MNVIYCNILISNKISGKDRSDEGRNPTSRGTPYMRVIGRLRKK